MKRTTPYLMILVLAISLGFFNIGTKVNADATTTFETGDRMTYFGDSWNYEYGENSFTAYLDPENNGTFTLARDEFKVREMNLDGNQTTDIFVIRNDHGFDTLLLINSQTEALPGSFYNETSVLYDMDPNLPPGEGNFSHYEDLTGQMWHDFNQEESYANATYAYIPNEFFAGDFSIPSPDFLGQAGVYLPDLSVGVTTSVTTGVDSFYINNQDFTNISVRIFTMQAFGSIAGTTNMTIDTPDFAVLATLDYNVTYIEDFMMVFDAANGFPLAVDRSQELMFNGNFSTGPVMVEMFDQSSGTYLNMTVDMSGDFSFDRVDSSYVELGFASSHYGLSRPISNGNPPLQEGDVLTYDWGTSSFSELYVYSEGNLFDENGTMSYPFISEGDFVTTEDGTGTTTLEVYRHHPDAFEALLWTDGVVTVNSEGIENFYDGTQWNNNSYIDPPVDYEEVNVQPIFSLSNASYEVWTPSPPSIPNPMFMGDNDGEGDNFLNDIFGVPIDLSFIPRDLPRTSMSVSSEGPTVYTINGFTFELSVEVRRSIYEATFSNTQFFDMFQISISGSIFVEETMVYDPATGVLLERGRTAHVEMTVDLVQNAQPAQMGDPMNPGMEITTATVELTGDFNEWNVLSEHPKKYLTGPTAPTNTTSPEPTNTSTVPTNGSSSAPVNSTSSSPSFESPLPGFEWAAPLTVFATLVILRKRRR